MRFLLLALAVCVSASATNIAVIDSGLDYKHADLKNNVWQNPASPQDVVVDGKTYANAIHGWNFPGNNNEVIDYKYLGTFSADCTKYYELQTKKLQGTSTADEDAWIAKMKADPAFKAELGKFGNFVHGTHVAGISAAGAPGALVVGLKLIPTEARPSGSSFARGFRSIFGNRPADNALVKMYLGFAAKRQAESLTQISKFAAAVDARVANGSFGTSVAALKPMLGEMLKQLLGAEPTEEDKEDYAKFFVGEIIKNSKSVMDAAPQTLFVLAAGNEASNNDVSPVSPANVKADNSITVAATNGTAALAPFSNYGETLVEVAAPGVGIDSTIPGDKRLAMSGTSMAAPYVTNVAGLMVDQNGKLSPLQTKQLLMGTVDVKPFLKGVVSTSGIVNKTRALVAARLSRTMPVSAAIAQARRRVRDQAEVAALVIGRTSELEALPLPSPF